MLKAMYGLESSLDICQLSVEKNEKKNFIRFFTKTTIDSQGKECINHTVNVAKESGSPHFIGSCDIIPAKYSYGSFPLNALLVNGPP